MTTAPSSPCGIWRASTPQRSAPRSGSPPTPSGLGSRGWSPASEGTWAMTDPSFYPRRARLLGAYAEAGIRPGEPTEVARRAMLGLRRQPGRQLAGRALLAAALLALAAVMAVALVVA